MKLLARVFLGLVVLAAIVVLAGGIFVGVNVSATSSSLEKVYDIAPLAVTRSTEPAVLARGKHLSESIGACATKDCHGSDFGGGAMLAMGPIGTFAGPNITGGGLGAMYTDGELARLIRHGVKKDGRSVRFMPTQDISWMPESDRSALVSYLRTVPNVSRANGPNHVGFLGKFLDQKNAFVIDVARRIDHEKDEVVPAPEPTAAYGKFLARSCSGCHGETFSGGRIPGSPAIVPTPLNITPHETGMRDWSFGDFDRLSMTGVRKNGQKLDRFMPVAMLANMDRVERPAIYAYLMTLPPKAMGGR